MNLLELKDVGFVYSKNKTEGVRNFNLSDISLKVEKGGFISIIGKNGSGKSTLVKLISKIFVNFSGSITYCGKDIHSIERKEFSRNVSYIPQSLASFGEDLKVRDFLLLGRYAHKRFVDFTFSAEDRYVVEESIRETSIGNIADRQMLAISGGERQKVFITLALVQLDITGNLDGKILIIDEPITYLDVNHQFEIFNILKRLQKKNLTTLIIIHDLNIALRYSDKTALLNDGKLVKFEETNNVITEEMLKEHFLIDSKILNFEKNYFINYYPV